MSKKNKIGLYARYSKLDGSFMDTHIKYQNDVYKSNKQSQSILWELITDDVDLIHQPNDYFNIPIKAKSWDQDMANSINPNMYLCDLCGEYFEKSEMDYIPDEDDYSECSQCKQCANN